MPSHWESLSICPKGWARTYAVLVGENEVASGEFAVKDLASGEQTKVPRGALVEFLDQHN